jgi:hypothetical protein
MEFDAADLPVDAEYQPNLSGERRCLVEQYYHAIDFTNWDHVRRLLTVYEHVLLTLEEDIKSPTLRSSPEVAEKTRRILITCLKRDGFDYANGRILALGNVPATAHLAAQAVVVDAPYIVTQVDRIQSAVENDPRLAIGTAKELVETTCKSILRERGAITDPAWDLLELVKATRKELRLTPADVPDSAKASDTVRRLLSNLATVVHGIAELRNPYGTGHGHDGRARGLGPRHARLAAGAAATLATFLLETHIENSARSAPIAAH